MSPFSTSIQSMGIHYLLLFLTQSVPNSLNDATQVCEIVVFLYRIAFDRVVLFIPKPFSEQLVDASIRSAPGPKGGKRQDRCSLVMGNQVDRAVNVRLTWLWLYRMVMRPYD